MPNRRGRKLAPASPCPGEQKQGQLPRAPARSFSSLHAAGVTRGSAGAPLADAAAFLSLNLQTFLSSYTEIRFNVKPTSIFFFQAKCAKSQEKQRQNNREPESGSLSSSLDINNIKKKHSQSTMVPSVRSPQSPEMAGVMCWAACTPCRVTQSHAISKAPKPPSGGVDRLHTDARWMK